MPTNIEETKFCQRCETTANLIWIEASDGNQFWLCKKCKKRAVRKHPIIWFLHILHLIHVQYYLSKEYVAELIEKYPILRPVLFAVLILISTALSLSISLSLWFIPIMMVGILIARIFILFVKRSEVEYHYFE